MANTTAGSTYTNAGSVYRFSLDTRFSPSFQTLSKLNPNPIGSNHSFGQALAYDGATLMVGAPGHGVFTEGRVEFWRLDPKGLSTRAIDMQVARLREKLRDDGESPEVLLTVRGTGYMLARTA